MSFWSLVRKDRILSISFSVCACSVLVFCFWSAFAPMAEGVVAFGRIAEQQDRIVVQHLEGGITEEIRIEEGDHVKQGDPLLVLTNLAAEAGRNQAELRWATTMASFQRVEALLAGFEDVVFDLSGAENLSDMEKGDIVSKQQALFAQQRETRVSSIAQIQSRRTGLLKTAISLQAEIGLQEVALTDVREELEVKRVLFDKRLVPREIVLNLEREESRLLSSIASLQTRKAEAESAASEAKYEISKTLAGLEESLGAERLKLQQEIVELNEQLVAARDLVDRSIISAPAGGTVLNLAFRTKGGVVRPGEPILEIVPEDIGSFAVLELRPTDRDAIKVGMQVEIRLSGIDSWRVRPIEGEIDRVSADLKQSADGRYSYYEARVRLSGIEGGVEGADILPGMPVEAFVNSGQSKTLLDYSLEPLAAVMRRGMRE
jgi:HlyD family type I secretion membrane fusion protein